MKALPSLFVGLAALLAGCSSWSNRQTPGLAGPQPPLQGDPQFPAAGPGIDPVPDPNVLAPAAEPGRAGLSPARTLELDDGSADTVIGQTAAHANVWRTEFESQQRRPIQTLRVGEGQQRILVTGSLRGDDAGSVWLLDAITARLTADSVATPASCYLFLRTPNPDGLAAGQPWNANGVELNRNFPSLRHLRRGGDRTGSFPASEPETRIMLRMLGDFQPDRVLQVRTDRVPVMRVFVNAAGESALGGTLDELDLERGRFDEVAVAGSLEQFASQRLQAETITVVVPEATARKSTTVDTLLTLCSGAASVSTVPEGTRESGSPGPPADAGLRGGSEARGPASLTGILEPIEQIEQDGDHGFVELLPPPPQSESGVDRPGFYELPPP